MVVLHSEITVAPGGSESGKMCMPMDGPAGSSSSDNWTTHVSWGFLPKFSSLVPNVWSRKGARAVDVWCYMRRIWAHRTSFLYLAHVTLLTLAQGRLRAGLVFA